MKSQEIEDDVTYGVSPVYSAGAWNRLRGLRVAQDLRSQWLERFPEIEMFFDDVESLVSIQPMEGPPGWRDRKTPADMSGAEAAVFTRDPLPDPEILDRAYRPGAGREPLFRARIEDPLNVYADWREYE